jgi:hypothetical protein
MPTDWDKKLKTFVESIWFFPSIVTLCLVLLTIFQISGSSIGMYHTFFYGDQRDPELLLNHPEQIRSDEWVVSSQMAIAQKNNHYAPINMNIGNGEDAELLGEMPYADWSIIFKPQNLGFFVMPFNNAFSFRWWIMAYFMVLGSYFFILALLPDRKMLAMLLSLGFSLSPFFHWWYIPSALATTYLSLFGMTVFIKLFNSKRKIHSVLWSLLLAYIAASFILILYPPFQIPLGIIIVCFVLGYIFSHKGDIKAKLFKQNLLFSLAAAVVAVMIAGVYLFQKLEVVASIENSVYPGHRTVHSGGYSPEHFLSSDISPLFQSQTRANKYSRMGATNAINQSESSNFILLFPFLLFPIYYLAYKKYKRTKKIDYLLAFMTIPLVCFLAWMFVPGIDFFGKLSLLDRVPLSRLIIGFGLLNLIFVLLFMKFYGENKRHFSSRATTLYGAGMLVFYLILNVHLVSQFPGFIGYKTAIALAIVIPLIIFLFTRKYFIAASVIIVLFSLISVSRINPIYHGTEVLTETKISQAIRNTEPGSSKKWISEDIFLENFAAMNGRPSLTGVYVYPQVKLWDGLHQLDRRDEYNRYAHTNFTFTRTATIERPVLRSPSGDQFNVKISPCDPFFKQENVGFLITSVRFDEGINPCTHLLKEVNYPKLSFYIYKVTF